MRKLQTAGLLAMVAVSLVASARPSAAVIIYPWCANYGGREYGASSCGSTSLKQCLATLWGNGGTCNPNPYYEPFSVTTSIRSTMPPTFTSHPR